VEKPKKPAAKKANAAAAEAVKPPDTGDSST